MSEEQTSRKEFISSLVLEMRRFHTSIVIFNEGIASKLHLNVTDLRCNELLGHTGPITAGQLSQLTNLTTGAITGVINRLEEAELVERIHDPKDRRKVIIQPLCHRHEEIARHFKPLVDSLTNIFEKYNDEELNLLFKFWKEINDLIPKETKRL